MTVFFVWVIGLHTKFALFASIHQLGSIVYNNSWCIATRDFELLFNVFWGFISNRFVCSAGGGHGNFSFVVIYRVHNLLFVEHIICVYIG